MAKIQIKSEELTPFGEICSIMEQFDSTGSAEVPPNLAQAAWATWCSSARGEAQIVAPKKQRGKTLRDKTKNIEGQNKKH